MRQFKSKVNNLTLPGAGVAPGVVSGRPFAFAGEVVTEKELGKHIVGLHDEGHERTLGIIEEIDPVPESELPDDQAPFSLQSGEDRSEGLTLPWESYSQETSADIIEQLRSATPQVVETVRAYEQATAQRKDILDFVHEHHAAEANRRGSDGGEASST